MSSALLKNFVSAYHQAAQKRRRGGSRQTRREIQRKTVGFILDQLRQGLEPTVSEIVAARLSGVYDDISGAHRCCSDALGQGHAKKKEHEGLHLHFTADGGHVLLCRQNFSLSMGPWVDDTETATTISLEAGFDSLESLVAFGESLPDAPEVSQNQTTTSTMEEN